MARVVAGTSKLPARGLPESAAVAAWARREVPGDGLVNGRQIPRGAEGRCGSPQSSDELSGKPSFSGDVGLAYVHHKEAAWRLLGMLLASEGWFLHILPGESPLNPGRLQEHRSACALCACRDGEDCTRPASSFTVKQSYQSRPVACVAKHAT